MRILFDQGTPVPLRRELSQHAVDTVYERGWSDLENGKLLDTAEQEGYELLITTDQNLKYQQDLSNRKIAILVLTSTSWPRIEAHADSIRAMAEQMRPGAYAEFEIPK